MSDFSKAAKTVLKVTCFLVSGMLFSNIAIAKWINDIAIQETLNTIVQLFMVATISILLIWAKRNGKVLPNIVNQCIIPLSIVFFILSIILLWISTAGNIYMK